MRLLFLIVLFSPGLLRLPAARADDEAAARSRRRTPVVEVFERCRGAVVNISTTRVQRVQMLRYGSLFDEMFGMGRPFVREREVTSVGSGVVIHEDGYIVTNEHVVDQATDIQVIFADKRRLPGRIVSTDTEHDLAILKVDAGERLSRVRLARAGDIMVGETAIAIGNPLGLGSSVTAGVISALDHDIDFNAKVAYRGLIQTDAAINPGNSGGPLLNVNGELMGINTAIRGDAQNVGFAIPVARLWELLPQMLDIERRERVRFGLEVRGREAVVATVKASSPAAEAGVQAGDRVITFDGTPVRDSIDFYVRLLKAKPGDTIHLDLRRNHQARRVAIRLHPIPAPDGKALARRLLGMDLVELDPAGCRRWGLDVDHAVVVEGVSPYGPADAAGILPGDVIITLNRTRTSTLEKVGLALEGVQPGSVVAIRGARVRTRHPFTWSALVRTASGH